MIVLSVDPGKMSGLCVVEVEDLFGPAVLHRSEELDSPQLWEALEGILPGDPPIDVVAERFIIGPATAKMTFQPWSLENIGAVRCIMHLSGMDPDSLALQAPAAAKALVDNDMLRRLGLWHRGGEGHANDAARHAVLYLVQHGWRPDGLLEQDDG